ncbi:MAG: type II toxin-antitoxin system RelB/DinJ family antitoxin [Oscillospiraceae bacterium]|jgi:DNA-damage-inducible protein J|nr:type II toxin-antitoxin system RelB/DinJ family antitoxin [Oscillospiraceae bacterium]
MAAEKANVSVKIDADVKEMAAALLRQMGMDVTTAIDMFFRQVIAEQRLPFQPALKQNLDEQILAAALAKNPRRIALDADENGSLIVDAEKHPDVYNWAVEG